METNLDVAQIWVGGLSLDESELLARVTGYLDDTQPDLYSPNNMAIIKVLTDGNDEDAGFDLEWIAGWLNFV